MLVYIYQIRIEFVGLFLPKKVKFEDKLDNSFTFIKKSTFSCSNSNIVFVLFIKIWKKTQKFFKIEKF